MIDVRPVGAHSPAQHEESKRTSVIRLGFWAAFGIASPKPTDGKRDTDLLDQPMMAETRRGGWQSIERFLVAAATGPTVAITPATSTRRFHGRAPTLSAPTSLSELDDCVDGGSFLACRRSQGARGVPVVGPGGVSWPETSPSSRRRRARG